MKATTVILGAALFFGFQQAQAQELFKSTNGKVTFFSEAPLENIQATTIAASSLLKVSSGEVAFNIPIKTFKFAKSLMEEHFNENYLESDKYPQATFTGKVIEKIDLESTSEQKVNVEGNLTIHGVTQKRQFPVVLRVENGKVIGHSQFKVKLADHKIEIPTLVFQNIAEIVDVTLDINYAPQTVN